MPVPVFVALAGFCGAFTGALLGSGAGIVMISFLLYLPPLVGVAPLDVKTATGLGATQILFASALGTLAHGRRGRVDRRLVLWVGPGMTVATMLAAIFSAVLPASVLLGAFALVATGAGLLMFVPARGVPDEKDWTGAFSRPLACLLGTVAGAFVGLVGTGTFVLSPGFLYVLRIPVRIAIGSTLGVSIFSALAATIGKGATGLIPPELALAILIGTIPGTQLGVRLSGRLSPRLLRGLLTVLIVVIAARAWWDLLRG